MKLSMTRRDAVLGAIGAAVAAAGAVGFPETLYAQSSVTAEQFLKLSETLTGASDLDPDLAKTLLGGLLAAGYGSAVAALANGETGPATTEVGNAIVAAWYSGLYETGKGQAVLTYDQALLWNALAFTKPMGECGGDTGYWGQPPQS